ncbi:MAG: protein translocase subunit SecF, partial [Mesorhizobium sp.]
VQQFGDPNDVLIRVGTQEGGENAEQTVIDKVRGELQDHYDFRRVEVVGPTVSGELAKQGTIAMLIALLGILVYVWFRFEWQFAVGAIIATVHDVVMTIGFFVITGLEFNQSSLAAILTIIGYSLNDTIVVYDRVREDLRKYKRMPLPHLLNNAINETLSRTTLTSVTTMLA